MYAIRLSYGTQVRRSDITAWAMTRLQAVLAERGVQVLDGDAVRPDELTVIAAFDGSAAHGQEHQRPVGAESFTITRSPARIEGAAPDLLVVGSDPRGLSYGILELADIVENSDDPSTALAKMPESDQSPATKVRGVLRTLASDVQDLSWFHDTDFWDEYLSHLATHRINRFHLALGMQYNYSHDPDAQDNYLAFAYPFLVAPDGFDVRPEGVSDQERQRNLASLRHIATEARRRGIHFQLGLWNHAYKYQDSPRERYPIQGLTPQTHAQYCRAALRDLLTECPEIDGVTIRVHYEGGVHEPSHEFWSIVMQGVSDSGRHVELDMHSKGMDSRILGAAEATDSDLTISAKFWAEHWGLPYHQAAVREMEYAKPERDGLSGVTRGARRFTRYGYGDFLTRERSYDFLFRLWPGSQRILEWGDPAQVAGIARSTAEIGGVGIELCEPLTFLGRKTTGGFGGRQPYSDPEYRTAGDPWTKYAYTYRLWGRLLYDPDADPGTWERSLERTHGTSGTHVGQALAAASRVLPLVTTYHSPSASNNFYWPEIYVNMPLAGSARSEIYAFDTPEPGTVGAVSPFDPEIFAPIDDYVNELLSRQHSGRYTPIDVADRLEALAKEADSHLVLARAADASGGTTAEFRRTSLDVAVLARLAIFYAEKTRAGVSYSLYVRTKRLGHLEDAAVHYRQAHEAFEGVVELTEGVYITDLAFGDRPSERGHWADRLPAITADLEDLDRELATASAERGDPEHDVDDRIFTPPSRVRPHVQLDIPAGFVPGESVPVVVTTPAHLDCHVVLHYRHLTQGEEWVTAPTTPNATRHTGTIPETYTDSPYELQLYVTVHDAEADAWIVPGFGAAFADQPYAVLPAVRGDAL